MSDVLSRVIEVTSEKLSVKKEDILPSSNFTEDLGADSLDLVELVMAFEEEFDIEIPDEESEKVQTVQDAVDAVNEKA